MASQGPLELQPSNQSQLAPPNATSCSGAPDAWDLLHRLLPTFIIAIFTLGLLGNSFVLSVFLLARRRLSVAEIYLANLAASDLVFVLGLPFWAENVRNQFDWPFGAALCRIVNGVIKANLFISIFLVVAISQDRYRVLVHPMASRRGRRRRQAQATCALIWLAGGLLSTPTFVLRSVRAVPELNVSACILLLPHEAWHWLRMVELNLLGFLLPLAAILFFNCHILASLRRRGARPLAVRGPPGQQEHGAHPHSRGFLPGLLGPLPLLRVPGVPVAGARHRGLLLGGVHRPGPAAVQLLRFRQQLPEPGDLCVCGPALQDQGLGTLSTVQPQESRARVLVP